MINLSKAISLLSPEARKEEGEREWIKEELPGPNRPPRRWWNRVMRQYREDFPELNIYQVTDKVKSHWEQMPEKDKINIRREMLKRQEKD